jgi:hypothetical protein
MTPRCLSRLITFAAMLLVLVAAPAGSVAQAPPPGDGPVAIDIQIRNDRPKFYVNAWVDRESRIYAEDDPLFLKVRCEEDAFLYVLYQQADGKIFQIFPNSGQPDNKIKAMTDVKLPSLDDGFRWIIGAPLGKEVIKVIASKVPVDALSLPNLKVGRFNPVTIEQFQGAGQQLGKAPARVWTEHDLEITTVRKGEPTKPPGAKKRVGVFFGVANYEFHPVIDKISGGKNKLNLRFADKDAVNMSATLKAAARLTDLRLRLNGEVTRDQVKKDIQWLHDVSNPGDTVFIYFSGHGAQIPDDTDEEKDRKDEVLVTHDVINSSVMGYMFSQKKKGELPPEWSERFERLAPGVEETYKREYEAAGGPSAEPESDRERKAHEKADEQVNAYLLRATAVDDDEMGHWVQKLDGRHVIVIVDACMSGGLTPGDGTANKGLKGGGSRAAEFDFLKTSFARLKDLNQPLLTVLAACAESETSMELSMEMGGFDAGLFTWYFMELVNKRPGPVDARQVLDYCRNKVADWFLNINRRIARKNETLPPDQMIPYLKGFVPQLFTTEPQPVFLKPAPETGS